MPDIQSPDGFQPQKPYARQTAIAGLSDERLSGFNPTWDLLAATGLALADLADPVLVPDGAVAMDAEARARVVVLVVVDLELGKILLLKFYLRNTSCIKSCP